jgi:hypothetical protein
MPNDETYTKSALGMLCIECTLGIQQLLIRIEIAIDLCRGQAREGNLSAMMALREELLEELRGMPPL